MLQKIVKYFFLRFYKLKFSVFTLSFSFFSFVWFESRNKSDADPGESSFTFWGEPNTIGQTLKRNRKEWISKENRCG